MSLLTRSPATRSASVTLPLTWDIPRMEREGKKLEHAIVKFEYNGITVIEQAPKSVSAASASGAFKFRVVQTTLGSSGVIPNDRQAGHAAAGADIVTRRQPFERSTVSPVVDASTWSGAADTAIGLTYQIVFGSPGRSGTTHYNDDTEETVDSEIYAVPAYAVATAVTTILPGPVEITVVSRLMVAGRPNQPPIHP